MLGFEPTASYKLIYIYAIYDQAHKGLLKIGEATLYSSKSYKELPPDCADLNLAARKRINDQNQTGGNAYELLYTELAVFEKHECDGSVVPMPISNRADKRVHAVLKASGIKQVCPNNMAANEWYEVDLATAKNAIKAMKEGRKSLTSAEIITDDSIIVLREEQVDAISRTKAHFAKSNNVLWYAKMRYGKSATALELIRQMKFRKVIIVTHRPVVGSGWQEDFYKIFKGDDSHYSFLFKEKSGAEDDYNQAIDSANDKTLRELDEGGKSFVYFASIQDLRGSLRVGGNYDKNNYVFDVDWDLLINDEAHEGTQTDLGKKVLGILTKKKTKVLSLSGTPFNIIDQYEDDGIYTWDYIMEQYAKEHWFEKHPDEPNPYEDLPKMHIYTYDLGNTIHGYDDYALEGKAFNFKEFFRVWKGNPEIDGREIPVGANAGEFVHASDVRSFLNLITKEDSENNYPYSTDEYRKMFKHTLWVIPGVQEAKALSSMLKKHPIFGNFTIINVAGEGDDDSISEDALSRVKKEIKENEYTITLTVSRLLVGTTVKEWSACCMLSGSYNTAASTYLQTIFRVQSPGVIDGKRKENCYVFDFAPDRSLRVFAEAAKNSRGVGASNSEEVLKQFLNFCPIIAAQGTQMKTYDVTSMMGQIKRIQVERAIRNGFDDNSIYNDELLKLNKVEIKEFNDLKKIVGSHQGQKQLSNVTINKQGFSKEEYEKIGQIKRKPPKQLTEEEKKLMRKLHEQRNQKKSAISILRAISIRLPLLIYGADVPLDQNITLDWFVDKIDPESWEEFMPAGVNKTRFKKFMKYYDTDVLIEAGREIRKLTKEADGLSPTNRVQKIATIFSYFKNPDKETVLTPWRTVNMHMSDCLGGWCFYDKDFNEDTPETKFRLEQPRYVDRGLVTENTLNNKNAKILEINSKSGLYPLYIAYNLYRARLGAIPEDDLTPAGQQKHWNEIICNNVFVICKTPMAKSITKRTLVGYNDIDVNAKTYKKMLETLKNNPRKFQKEATSSSWWNKEGDMIRFNGICSNPPYMLMAQNGSGMSATPQYNYFVEQAKMLEPDYVSMIIPARWYTGVKALDDFRAGMLKDGHISKLVDYGNAKDVFTGVDIAGGICYFLWDKNHTGDCCVISRSGNEETITYRKLDEFEVFVRDSKAIPIIHKVFAKDSKSLAERVISRVPFGINTNYKPKESGVPCWFTQKVGLMYADAKDVSDINGIIGKWKFLAPKTPIAGQTDFSKPVGFYHEGSVKIGKPGEICTDSSVVLGAFDTEEETKAFKSYILTKTVRFLLLQCVSSQDVSKEKFKFVPDLETYTGKYTDEELCNRWGITDEEWRYINSRIHNYETLYANKSDDETS